MNNIDVIGAIDPETRCTHYHSEKDRLAIKFYCCQHYFSCVQCHAAYGCGNASVWPQAMFDHHAILCGTCRQTFTIHDYLYVMGNQCPNCLVAFNPNCARHHHFYFGVDPIGK